MENWIKLTAWGGLIFLLFVTHYCRGKRPMSQELDLSDFMNLALCSGGIISSLSVMYQVVGSKTLSQILVKEIGFDIITLVMGAAAVIWVSIQQIAKLFEEHSFVGKVDDFTLANTEKLIYLMSVNQNKVYRVIVPEYILNKVPDAPQKLDEIKGKTIRVTGLQPTISGRISEFKVTHPQQLNIE